MSISSETAVERSFGNEVLEHSKEAIDLSFLASGRANLLLDHDPKQVVGVIEDVYLDEDTRRLRAKVRFGRSELASSVYADVKDGIRSNISVGYQIERLERKDDKTYVARKWKPLEASIVSIPADMSEIGIGRSAQVSTEIAESVTLWKTLKLTLKQLQRRPDRLLRRTLHKSLSSALDTTNLIWLAKQSHQELLLKTSEARF